MMQDHPDQIRAAALGVLLDEPIMHEPVASLTTLAAARAQVTEMQDDRWQMLVKIVRLESRNRSLRYALALATGAITALLIALSGYWANAWGVVQVVGDSL